MYTIKLSEKRFTKNPNTKTTYILESEKDVVITEDQYNNYIDSISFFRRLGGTESTVKGYTAAGFKIIELNSTSPDRKTKVKRSFSFVWESK